MSRSLNLNRTDTAIAGNPTQNLTRGNVNFDTDWRVKTNNPGKEVVLTNVTSPIDCPERFRIAYTEIGNVYAGSGVEKSVYAPTTRGVSVLVQLTEVLTVTDSTDAAYRVDLPVSYHLVIKVPANELITESVVQAGVARLLSGLYDTGVTTTARLAGLLRGSLVPSDV